MPAIDRADAKTNTLLRALDRRLQAIYNAAYDTAIANEKAAIRKLAAFHDKDFPGLTEIELRAKRLTYLTQVQRTTGIVKNIAAEIARSGETAARIIYGDRLNIYDTNYSNTIDSIDRRIDFNIRWDLYDRNQLKAILDNEIQPFEKVGAREVYDRKQRQYIRERAFGRLGDDKIIVRRLQNELTQAAINGESIPKIAARIKAVTEMSRRQAVTVARTEMLRVANQGRYLGYDNAVRDHNIDMCVRWIATRDKRTRPDHVHMDGATVEFGETFDMPNGDKMMFPLDPNGSAENVVNCRCISVAILKGFDFE